MEIVCAANDISTPALYLWGTFMEQQEAIVIYPDHDALTTLSGVQGGDLEKAKTFDGSDMLADKSSTGALASTISNTIGGVAQSMDLTRLKSAGGSTRMTRKHHRSQTASGDTDTYIAFPNSTPNMVYQARANDADRTYVRGSVPEWTTIINTDGTMSFQPQADALEILAGSALDFGAFLNNIAHGVHKVVKVVAKNAGAVYHTITDELGQIYNFVVDTVEKAISVVSSVLKSVVKDIVKAVEWLSWLFNWGDMLDTKNQIKTALTNNAGKLKTWLLTQQSNFGSVHGLMRTVAASNGTDQASNSLAGKSFQSVQVQNNDPQAPTVLREPSPTPLRSLCSPK